MNRRDARRERDGGRVVRRSAPLKMARLAVPLARRRRRAATRPPVQRCFRRSCSVCTLSVAISRAQSRPSRERRVPRAQSLSHSSGSFVWCFGALAVRIREPFAREPRRHERCVAGSRAPPLSVTVRGEDCGKDLSSCWEGQWEIKCAREKACWAGRKGLGPRFRCDSSAKLALTAPKAQERHDQHHFSPRGFERRPQTLL